MQRAVLLLVVLATLVAPALPVAADYFIYMTPTETVRDGGQFAATIAQANGIMNFGSSDEGMASAEPTNLLTDGAEDLFFRQDPHGLPDGVIPTVAAWGRRVAYGAVDFASVFSYDSARASARYDYEARFDAAAISPVARAARSARDDSWRIFNTALDALRRNVSQLYNSSSLVVRNASDAYLPFAPANFTVLNRSAALAIAAVELGDGIFVVSGTVRTSGDVVRYRVSLDQATPAGGTVKVTELSRAVDPPRRATGFVAVFERLRSAANATGVEGPWQRVAYFERNETSFGATLAVSAASGRSGRHFAVGAPEEGRVDLYSGEDAAAGASESAATPSWRWVRSITASSLAAHLSATSHFGAALALGEAALVIGCPDALGSSSAIFVFAIDVDHVSNASSVRAEPNCRLTHPGERLGAAVTLQTQPASMITTVVAGRPDGTTPGIHAWRFSAPATGSSGSSSAPAMTCVEMNSVTGFKMSDTDETATAIGYGDETLHFAAPKAINSDLGTPGMDGRLYISKYCFPNRVSLFLFTANILYESC